MTAVIVRKSWANLQAIQVFLRGRLAEATSDDSDTILARVLDDNDQRGLWIELETEKALKDAAFERPALMIPWTEVLAMVVAKDLAAKNLAARKSAAEKVERLELSLTGKQLL